MVLSGCGGGLSVSLRCRGGLSPSLFCRVSSGGFRFLGDESWVEVCSRRWCLSLVPISKGSVGCLEGVFYGFIHGISTSLITGDLPCLVLVLILLVNGDGPLHQMLVLVLHVSCFLFDTGM